MKEQQCILCDGRKKRVISLQKFNDDYLQLINPEYNNLDRYIVECEDCGFIYRDPQLDNSDLLILYDRFRDMSFRNESHDEYFDRITNLPDEKSENFHKVNYISNNIKLSEEGKILDIGCGGGVFINSFIKHFSKWLAFGVEPTPAFADLAARRLSRPVISGEYKNGLFENKFDLITAIHVLEHIKDPKEFLICSGKDLIDNGYIYLEVPSAEDFDYLPPNHDRFMAQHLWIFSEETLARLCKAAGFEVVKSKSYKSIRNRRNLSCIIRKLTKN